MRKRGSLRLSLPPVLVLAAAVAGCVPNQAYRKAQPVVIVEANPTSFPVAFIEFDDFGQLHDPNQIDAAVREISKAQSGGKSIVTVVFIHGWKNNASDDSGNVWGFRRVLQGFRESLGVTPLVGVYIGWRGAVTNAPVAKQLTFWDRRNRASYIPSAHMTEALIRITQATKGRDFANKSKCVIVGHSFGGLVLERAVNQHLARQVAAAKPGETIRSFADLLVFVNEAAPAIEAVQLLDMLDRHVLPSEYPTIVSITSKGDIATKFALPGGQFLSLPKNSLRDYNPPFYGKTNQRSFFLQSAANMKELQSHEIGPNSDPAINAAYLKYGYLNVCLPDVHQKSSPQNGTVYDVIAIPDNQRHNKTPYWIMQMPTEIVPDHSSIFRDEFARLLQAFVLRQTIHSPTPPAIVDCGLKAKFDKYPIQMENMRGTMQAK